MPDNLYDSKNNLTEIKLVKLYTEQNLTALRILELQDNIFNAINNEDGIKLENYSLFEKELIHKLVNIKKVIKSFETNFFNSSVDLDNLRALGIVQQKQIKVRGIKNRKTLTLSLKNISSRIDTFSRKILYSAPFFKQAAPQFVDLSI